MIALTDYRNSTTDYMCEHDVQLGKWYLTTRHFNANRVIKQPARLISIDRSAEICILEYTDGKVNVLDLYMDPATGVLVFVSPRYLNGYTKTKTLYRFVPTLFTISEAWLKQEKKKLIKKLDEAQQLVNNIEKVEL